MNEYGLDSHYFNKKLKAIIIDINHYAPYEMINELRTLLAVAERQKEMRDQMLENIKPSKKTI